MKYLKLYEDFMESESLPGGNIPSKNNYDIIPYPFNQNLDKSKSVILVPGGDVGKPENDYSKIAPALTDSYNVYSLSWPKNIDLKLFGKKIADQINDVIKTPFCLVGFSYGVPICWRIAQNLEGKNENYKNLIISIDGSMLVDDVAKHIFNSLSGNPPRKLTAKRLDFYKSELGVGQVKEEEDVNIINFYYQYNPNLKLEDFDKLRKNPKSAVVGKDIIWDDREYNDWKVGKQVKEFIGDTKTPTIDDIKDLKDENIWIVCDKETDGKTPLHIRSIEASIGFFDEQQKDKTGFVLDKGEKLNNTQVLGIIALDTKVGKQEVKSNNEVILTKKDGSKETINIDWLSKSQKLIGIDGCGHNTICDGKTSEVVSVIKTYFK